MILKGVCWWNSLPVTASCWAVGWKLEQWDILGGAAETRLPSFTAICSSLCKHGTALGLC